MKTSAISLLLLSGAIAACASAAPAAIPVSAPLEAADVPRLTEIEPRPSKQPKTPFNTRPCPEGVHLSAYRNFMPGPGYNPSGVPVGISLYVKDGKGWAANHETSIEGDTILLSLFPASTHVKPPARSLAPVKPVPGRSTTSGRRVSYRILNNDATRVAVRCKGEIIAETKIGAAH